MSLYTAINNKHQEEAKERKKAFGQIQRDKEIKRQETIQNLYNKAGEKAEEQKNNRFNEELKKELARAEEETRKEALKKYGKTADNKPKTEEAFKNLANSLFNKN